MEKLGYSHCRELKKEGAVPCRDCVASAAVLAFNLRAVSYTHLDVYKRQYTACTEVIDPFRVEVIRSCIAPISVARVG